MLALVPQEMCSEQAPESVPLPGHRIRSASERSASGQGSRRAASPLSAATYAPPSPLRPGLFLLTGDLLGVEHFELLGLEALAKDEMNRNNQRDEEREDDARELVFSTQRMTKAAS